MSQLQVTGEAKIRDLQGPVVANSGVITALDGAASQYVRGDGTLADFPTATGGGSSVSYYLNGSVNQGTFGGSTYYQMSKNAITGAGTNFSTSSNGLLAQFITDANDPDQTSIPSGNWNIEFFMGVSASSGSLASFYVEFYKYNGSTFTLLATNSATPEFLTNTTTVDAYFTSVAFAETPLATTDRLAIRIYANVASKTVTLYTEDNRLCQVVTTFSRGILSLNNLTDQQQYFAVGTSGTDFNIVSSLDTHTFNIPSASATNRGLITTGTQTIAGQKTFEAPTYLNNFAVFADGFSLFNGAGTSTLSGPDYTGIIASKSGSFTDIQIKHYLPYISTLRFSNDVSDYTYTFPNITGTLALLEGTQTFSGAKTFSGKAGFTNSNGTGFTYGIGFNKGFAPTGLLSSAVVNLYSDATDNNIVIKDNLSTAKLVFDNSTQTYTFPASSGTIALTSNLSSYVPYSGATSDVNLGINRLYSTGLTLSTSATAFAPGLTTLNGNSNGLTISLGTSSGGSTITYSNQFLFSTNVSNTYTFPNASGTVALTSNFDGYVPYTGATSSLNLGSNNITTTGLATLKTIQAGTSTVAGVVALKSPGGVGFSFDSGSINLIASDPTEFRLLYGKGSGNSKSVIFSDTSLTLNTPRTYTLPDATGTIALTSNIPSVSGTSGQVTYFNGTSSVTGSSNHFWDATNNRLGIGLTNPQRSLEIYSATADSHLRLSGSAPSVSMGEAITGSVYQAKFGLATASGQYVSGAVAGDFVMLSQTGATIFATSATEKARITSGGNLLVGTTSDNGAKLQVSGNATVNNALNTEAMNVGGTLFLQTTADGSIGGKIYGYNDTSVNLYSSGLKFQTRYFNGSAYVYRDVLTLASTGAATFSSSVTANGYINNYLDQGALRLYNSSTVFAGGIGTGAWVEGSATTDIAIYSANNLKFYSGSSSTAKMTITSGGNVGIGTSSPVSIGGYTSLTINGASGSFTEYQQSGSYSFRIGSDSSIGGFISQVDANPIRIFTNSTERMRITSGGNVGIGTSSPSEKLDVIGGAVAAGNGTIRTGITYSSLGLIGTFTNHDLGIITNGTTRLTLNASTGSATFTSSVTATAFFESSDKRLKNEINDNPTIANIESVKPKLYTKNDVQELGYYAQDFQEILPSAVSEGADGFLSLSYTQVHTAKIAQLEHKIAQLEELIKTLTNGI